MTDVRTWVLVLHYKRPPLTLNQRMHWAPKHKLNRQVRDQAAYLARHHGIPPLGRCRVELTWVVADRRRRDADNIQPTLKAICDGLVDAGIVTDDTPDLMQKPEVTIRHEHGATPHLEVRVREVTA